MILTAEAHAAFAADAVRRHPEEACGLIVNDQYVPAANTAEDPRLNFRISPHDYVAASSAGDVQAIVHSHPYKLTAPPTQPPEWPSTADMTGWMASGVPWGIAATDGEGISQLVWLDEANPHPLVGREFIHGINDCYSLIRDWFRQERGIVIPNFARGMEWWFAGKDLYDENFERAGFVTIPFDQLQVGDCVMFKVRSPVTNHAAVVTGPNQILHHMFHRLSGHDSLSKWERVINRAVRYVGV